MDAVTDLMIERVKEVEDMRFENKKMKEIILRMRYGIILLGIFSLIMIWMMFYKGRELGYEEAVKDFYKGSMKAEIINEEMVWK